MRVVHDDSGSTAVERTHRRCIRLRRHLPARTLVFGVPGSRLLRMDDAGDTLDVDGDQDLQELPLDLVDRASRRMRFVSVSRDSRGASPAALIAARSSDPAHRATRRRAG
jgi:hypothetical protein